MIGRHTLGDARIIHGDCLEELRKLDKNSVHAVVTSPPYFGLREYSTAQWAGGNSECDHAMPDWTQDPGDAGLSPGTVNAANAANYRQRNKGSCPKCGAVRVDKQIGQEATADAYVAKMVSVFREVRRVVHQTGVLWLNLGDTYSQHNAGQLLNIPHRVAEALRADGWVWRQTIVWSKPSPMPESISGWRWVKCRIKMSPMNVIRDGYERSPGVRAGGNVAGTIPAAKWEDCPGCLKCEPNGGWVLRKCKGRACTAHEYIFVFAKSPLYFWCSEQINRVVADYENMQALRKTKTGQRAGLSQLQLKEGQCDHNAVLMNPNVRSVWFISSEPTKEKHFAAFPSEIPHRAIAASTSDAGCCAECGSPWAPIVTSTRVPTRPGNESKTYLEMPLDPDSPYWAHSGMICGNRDPKRHCTQTVVHGYRPTCECGAAATPCVVLDPFAGTGTSLQVASWMGRDAVGIELSREYIEIANVRLKQEPRCLAVMRDSPKKKAEATDARQQTLFPDKAA